MASYTGTSLDEFDDDKSAALTIARKVDNTQRMLEKLGHRGIYPFYFGEKREGGGLRHVYLSMYSLEYSMLAVAQGHMTWSSSIVLPVAQEGAVREL